MRIAMVAPLAESVPPRLYGGTDRVVSVLTEELVRRGHDVTLFASGDSRTRARLVACSSQGLRLDPIARDFVACTTRQLDAVYTRAEAFDIIHNHVDHLAFPFASCTTTPTVTTTHGRLDLGEIQRAYRRYLDQPLVSISDAQRRSLPSASWIATVPNGVDLANFHFRAEPGSYLVFLGRICPEKRPDRAIEIARHVGMPLVIAAKVDPVDRAYYDHVIAPLIRTSPFVDYIGEVDEQGKDHLLGGAYAYLFPIDWPEPFGLTMAEAMATGTPVVASNTGSVPEVLRDGVTGFICNTIQEMVDAVDRVRNLDRASCRAHVERSFSSATMADGYEHAYLLTLEGVSASSVSALAGVHLTPHPSPVAVS